MRKPGLEPGRVSPLDPKSSASTNSATSAAPLPCTRNMHRTRPRCSPRPRLEHHIEPRAPAPTHRNLSPEHQHHHHRPGVPYLAVLALLLVVCFVFAVVLGRVVFVFLCFVC